MVLEVQSDVHFGVKERNGWDILKALAAIKAEYKHDSVTMKAATAVEKRVRMVRSNCRDSCYFLA